MRFVVSSVATAVWPRLQQLLQWPCDTTYCAAGGWRSRSCWLSSW